MTYHRPSLSLLSDIYSNNTKALEEADVIRERLQACFAAHAINAEVVDTRVSPINYIFDVKLNGGRYKDVINRESDISYSVGNDVKIFQSDDASGVFSISVLRSSRSYVSLKSILASREFEESPSELTIGAGIDERGNICLIDLKENPHMLISGTTGAGKTVFLDDIILSLVYKSSPEQVRLILIDPSAKDLSYYSRLPHLSFPVVNDKGETVEVVKKVRDEMNNRFHLFSLHSVKNIESFNLLSENKLPRIVVVIDKMIEFSYEMPYEFADCINEIARKGRAAGIHLILNTQSARSDIISNDIKANFTCRVAFSVVDWHESKAILDKTGAQKLLGNGDMLLVAGENKIPLHVQAAFVSEGACRAVVKSLIEVNKTLESAGLSEDASEKVAEAGRIRKILLAVSNTKSISVFTIQKILGVGFGEASNIMDFLEQNNAVTAFKLGKERKVNQTVIDELLRKYEE